MTQQPRSQRIGQLAEQLEDQFQAGYAEIQRIQQRQALLRELAAEARNIAQSLAGEGD